MTHLSLGFVQGRLSPMVDGKIQSFPWNTWKEEFSLAQSLGLKLMEWTLDQNGLDQNPLLSPKGREQIRNLCNIHSILIPSLTGDCFMQAPFWKADVASRSELQAEFVQIARACSDLSISMIIVPLVDNGRIENGQQEKILLSFLLAKVDLLRSLNVKIVFESDFTPIDLARFIVQFPPDIFGINYDIGNSASLGFNPTEEFFQYGSRITNVHIKDRVLGGTTVPLGTGNADFFTVFRLLRDLSYKGNLIMQVARATDGDHVGVLRNCIAYIDGLLKETSFAI